MAYGFQVLNQDGVLVANDTDFNYALLTSGTRQVGTLDTYGGAATNNAIRYDSLITTSDPKPLIFIKLTDPNYYIGVLGSNNTSTAFVLANAAPDADGYRRTNQVPSTAAVTIHYKVFVPFNKLPAYSGTDSYGMQVFTDSANKTFDSRYEIPIVVAAGTCAANTPYPYLNQTAVTLPTGFDITNTWICINPIAENTIGIEGINNGTRADVYQGIRISGNTLYMSQLHKIGFSAYTGQSFWGNISRTFLLADQPNIAYPLKLALNLNAAWTTNVCQINYALQYDTGRCFTTFRYEAEVSGGNGNLVSYNWSLSEVTPSTAQVVGSDANKSFITVTCLASQGTYTCTLTCTITQPGSQTQTKSVTITSTHNQNILSTAALSIDGKSSPYTITEGETVTFRVNTSGVPNGDTIYWGLDSFGLTNPIDLNDFTPTTLYGYATVNSNVATFQKFVTIGAIENTEQFKFKVWRYGSGENLMASLPVSVANSTVSSSHSVTADVSSIDEANTQTVYFTLNTTEPLAQVWWRIEGVSGTINTNDFVDSSGMSGSAYIGITTDSEGYPYNLTEQVPKTARADTTTEGTESFTLKLYSNSSFTTLLANGPTVTIGDTSTTPPPPAPVASFTKSAATGAYPLTVNFTDTSTNNPTSWSWNFGNGTTSNVQSPQGIVYSTAGTFTVTLTAGNSGGSSSTSQNIIVTAPVAAPVASFTKTVASGAAPLYVEFTDTSTNTPTTWSWNFGDGTTSTLQNPTKTYGDVASSTNYTVSLTAENNGGSSSTNQTVTVTPAVVTISTAGDSNGTTGTAYSKTFNLKLNGNNQPTNFSYNGSIPPGLTFTKEGLTFNNFYMTYKLSGTPTAAAVGTYNFTVYGTSSSGYQAQQSYTITISAPAAPLPVADFTADPTTVGLDQVVTFTDASTNAVTWQWDFNNSGTYVSTAQNPTRSYVDSGIYSVKLRVTNSDGVESIKTRTNYITVVATNYNEVMSMDNYLTYTARATDTDPSIYTVYTNQIFNMFITGGRPNRPFSWTGANSGTGTLDANGNYTWTNNQVLAQEYNWTVTLVLEGTIQTPITTHQRKIRITGVTPPSATVPNPLSFNGSTFIDNSNADGYASISLLLLRNGNWSVERNNGNTDSGTWVSPTASTVGDGFWCRFTRGATTTASTTVNTTTTYTTDTGWLQLNGTQGVTVTINTGSSSIRSSQVTYTVEISTNSTGTNIVSTTSFTLRVTARVQ